MKDLNKLSFHQMEEVFRAPLYIWFYLIDLSGEDEKKFDFEPELLETFQKNNDLKSFYTQVRKRLLNELRDLKILLPQDAGRRKMILEKKWINLTCILLSIKPAYRGILLDGLQQFSNEISKNYRVESIVLTDVLYPGFGDQATIS